MPQQQRKPSAVEIFERGQQQPQRRPSAVEIFERGHQQQQQPQEPPGFLENLAIGAERGYRNYLLPAASSIAEVTEGMKRGDFGPLAQILTEAGRGVVSSLAGGTELPAVKAEREAAEAWARSAGIPGAVGANPLRSLAASQQAPIAAAQAAREARYQSTPQAQASRQRLEELNRLAALDPSIAGKLTRGGAELITGASPTLAAGVLSGGSLPIIALAAAAQSANNPAMIGPSVAAGMLPLPVGKVVAPILRRIRGARGAVAGAEAEASGGGLRTPTIAREAAASGAARAVEAGAQAADQYGFTQAFSNLGIGENLKNALRSSVARTGKLPGAEAGSTIGRAYEAAVAGGAPRDVTTLDAVMLQLEGQAAMRAPSNVAPESLEEIGIRRLPPEASALPAYQPQARAPMLEEAAAEPFGVSLSASRPRLPGAAGPRINEYGFVEGGADPATVLTKAERTKFLDVLSAFRKAGLIKLTTHLKNLGGNLGFQISEEAARIPGAVVDLLISPLTGRRTFTGMNFRAIGRSAYEAATRGRREAWDIIKNGSTQSELERLGLNGEISSGSKVIDSYINYTFRLLNAEDRLFKVYAMRRALEDRARSLVLTEIRQGKLPRGRYAERFNEVMANPGEDLAAGAVLDSEVATFTNPNRYADAYSAFVKELPRGAQFAADQVVPFVRTPANVLARVLEYSGITSGPKAAAIGAKAILKRSMSAAEQRAFSQTLGRASVGGALIALGYVGYRDGWLTGMREDDPSRVSRDQALGRTPGAIRLGQAWHQIAGFSPVGNLLAIGATIAREAAQERSDYLGATAEAIGQTVLEQPMLSGTQAFIKGVQQPGSAGARALGGIAASYIPGHVADVAQIIDPKQREAATIAARVMERVPGARNVLPQRVDVLGRPVEGSRLGLVDPTRTAVAQERANVLFAELVRLDKGISAVEPQPDETPAAFDTRRQAFGEALLLHGGNLVSSGEYAGADNATRYKALGALEGRIKAALLGRAEVSSLSPRAVFDSLREAERSKPEREKRQQQQRALNQQRLLNR